MKLEKSSSLGAIVTAALCPICFPKLALVGSVIGLGSFYRYELFFLVLTHALVLLSLVGNIFSYLHHRDKKILVLAMVSTLLFFTSLYLIVNEYLSYLALIGLVATFVWQILLNKHRVKTGH